MQIRHQFVHLYLVIYLSSYLVFNKNFRSTSIDQAPLSSLPQSSFTTNSRSAASTGSSLPLAAFLHFCGQHPLLPHQQMSVFILIEASTLSLLSLLRKSPHFLFIRKNRSHQAWTSSTIYFQAHLPGSHATYATFSGHLPCRSTFLSPELHLLPFYHSFSISI